MRTTRKIRSSRTDVCNAGVDSAPASRDAATRMATISVMNVAAAMTYLIRTILPCQRDASAQAAAGVVGHAPPVETDSAFPAGATVSQLPACSDLESQPSGTCVRRSSGDKWRIIGTTATGKHSGYQ